MINIEAFETETEHPPMSRAEWWCFMRWNDLGRRASSPSFYEFLMFGMIANARPIVRFDHPGRKLAEKYFSARLLGEKRTAV